MEIGCENRIVSVKLRGWSGGEGWPHDIFTGPFKFQVGNKEGNWG